MACRSGKKPGGLPPEMRAEFDRFKEFLRESGLRLTPQRETIFREVFRHHEHLDADEITGRLRRLGKRASRATVYRTLELLVEAGLVKSVRLSPNMHYFEHVHSGEHHDHLVCQQCGRVIEFLSPEIEELQSRVCDKNDFAPVRHTMIIFGICARCREKA